MLKHFLIALLLIQSFALSALAQDAGEVARAEAGKDCKNCNLFQADLAFKDMPGVNFAGSRLRQADLSLVTFDGASLAGANVSIANLFGGRFEGVDFGYADLTESSLVGGYFGGANLTGARLSGANIAGAELAGAKGLTQSQLDGACGDAATTLPTGLKVKFCR